MKDVLERATIRMDRNTARQAFLAYRNAVRERHNAEDAQIMRGYRALSQGQMLINLRQVIEAGGIFPGGLPKLAVAQSDTQFVYVTRDQNGAVRFLPKDRWQIRSTQRKGVFSFPSGTMPTCPEMGCDMSRSIYTHGHKWTGDMRAMVPNVPAALRPAHSLSGYCTLFEVAEWTQAPRPPGDPALLKHIGGEIYAVLAVWDLTPLEQAVLAGRNLP